MSEDEKGEQAVTAAQRTHDAAFGYSMLTSSGNRKVVLPSLH